MTRARTALGLLVMLVAGAVHAQAPSGAPRWRLSASAEGAFDSNPKFAADDGGTQASAWGRLGALVERAFTLPRTRLALRAEATRLDYRSTPELSRNTWGVEAQGTRAFSPRVTLGVHAAERSDASRDLRALTDTGFVLGQVLTRTTRARADLAWRVAEHATLAAESRYERYSFDSDAFVGGSTLDGNLRLDLQPWPRTSLTLAADVQRQRRADAPDVAPVADGSTRSFSATWIRGVPEHVQVSATAGLMRLVPLGTDDARSTALLGAGLRARRGRHTLDLRADRRVSEAFGLGRSGLSLTLTASDSLALAPRVALALRGNWSRTTDPGDGAFELRSWGATSELSWRVRPRLRAAAAYTYYRGEERGAAPRSNHVARLTLAYEQLWR